MRLALALAALVVAAGLAKVRGSATILRGDALSQLWRMIAVAEY